MGQDCHEEFQPPCIGHTGSQDYGPSKSPARSFSQDYPFPWLPAEKTKAAKEDSDSDSFRIWCCESRIALSHLNLPRTPRSSPFTSVRCRVCAVCMFFGDEKNIGQLVSDEIMFENKTAAGSRVWLILLAGQAGWQAGNAVYDPVLPVPLV